MCAEKALHRKKRLPQLMGAGGFASIAHPGKSPEMLEYILSLKRDGLAGVEAFHRMHSVDLVRQYIRFAQRNSLIVTGGSDCHGPYKEYKATAGSISIPKDIVVKFWNQSTRSSFDFRSPASVSP